MQGGLVEAMIVENYMVHVEHPLFVSKVAPVGGTKPVMIAWLLLSELVRVVFNVSFATLSRPEAIRRLVELGLKAKR